MMTKNHTALLLMLGSLSLPAATVQAAGANPKTAPAVIAAAVKEGQLTVYATTDQVVAAPLLKDFAVLYPKIKVEYNDMNSTEVYNRFVSEAAAGSGSGDVLWSSSMDLQVKLAKEGYAAEYKSPELDRLPAWANWKGLAYGTTYEPIVFVYNKRLLKEEEAPKSHADLVKLLQAQKDRFKGKLTAYDPERSGVGFLLITQDAKIDPAFDTAAKAYGAVGVKLYTSIGAMLERIQSGEHILGFNIFSSYAAAKQKKDPSLGISFPKDYLLVMSRVAVLPKVAKHPNAGKVFLDYLLSARGQEVVAHQAGLGSIRNDVTGEGTAVATNKAFGAAVKPIPVSDSILEYLDQAKRLQFLNRWQKALGTK
jgi:iron(III) transport system substrate-binding protein